MDEKPTTTSGIRSAQGGALAVLQHEPAGGDGSHLFEAAMEIARHHAPVGDQQVRHEALAVALGLFLTTIVTNTPPGPERSTAINWARSAKHWASAAISLEGR